MNQIISRFLPGAFLIVIFISTGSILIQEPAPIKGELTISMEGKDHRIPQLSSTESNIKVEGDSYRFLLRNSEVSPVQINVNITDPELMKSGSNTYNIPEDNSPKILMDLNFFDADREVSRMNKRIIFRKGTITIQSFGKDQLIMKFDGEGSGMREREGNFEISGSISVTY
ncbi:MAG: hypothetical protein RIC06_01650 [Cyclobacteriaceae bacterium]